jgi:signal transduction histidine kinase
MLKWLIAMIVALSPAAYSISTQTESPNEANGSMEIHSVIIDDKPVAVKRNVVNLGPSPGTLTFLLSPATNSPKPVRIRYKLDGVDTKWRDGYSFMTLTVRFFNATGDQISQNIFSINGESAGWDGSLKSSPLTHRREAITVPPKASRLWIVVSSAGPPETVGVYVVANLIVSKQTETGQHQVIIESPFDRQIDADSDWAPPGWKTDGIHPSMAKIVTVGQTPGLRAFAILDDDGGSHAEWRTIMESAPVVSPGDQLLIEWNEMYSIGSGNVGATHYTNLLQGKYEFHVAAVDIFGNIMGTETSLTVLVPPPFWQTSWFWSVVATLAFTLAIGGGRYLAWHRMRREMSRLKSQQTLDKERLRIAQDIHDDLGASITEISLASALAQKRSSLSPETSDDFKRIHRMSRELVSALYETVWAVNPENDNLDALGGYLCQMTNRLGEQAQLSCRLVISDLPRDIEVSSQTRHNVIMTVKEALHNVVKHAKASEAHLRVSYENELLTIQIHDNGCGFETTKKPTGNGLVNMKRRLVEIGGACIIESRAGGGTTVEMRLQVRKPKQPRASIPDPDAGK